MSGNKPLSPQMFAEVKRAEIFQTDQVDGILQTFPVVQQQMILSRIMPLTTVNSYKIKLDVDKALRGGMTPAVAAGSSSPLYDIQGRGSIEWEPAEFREKVRLVENELHDFRRLGTLSDYETAREKLSRKTAKIERRLARRLEWMRRQVLFDGQVTYEERSENGAKSVTVNYEHPDYLNGSVQAATSWDTASAEPLQDMQLWVEEYELQTGYMLEEAMLPLGTLRILTQNQDFQNIAQNSYGSFKGARPDVRQIILDYAGIGQITEQRARFNESSYLTADAAASATSITLESVHNLAAGDTLLLKNANRASEKVTVDTISGNTVNLTAGLSNAYQANDMATWRVMTIPTDRILMIGAPDFPIDPEGQPQGDQDLMRGWAEMVSTLSHYDDLENPRAGLFRKSIARDGDPPYMEQVIGIRALPIVHYSEGWMAPTIIY